MQRLGEGLGQAVGQGLGHDRGIVVVRALEALGDLDLPDAGGDREAADTVGLAVPTGATKSASATFGLPVGAWRICWRRV